MAEGAAIGGARVGDAALVGDMAKPVWAIYHNFTPAQWRSACPDGLSRERKRNYRRPGQSSLAVAGHPPGGISYTDTDLHVPGCLMRSTAYRDRRSIQKVATRGNQG